ncbi:hypothetical protein BCAR13_410079 [Paraburkholderia caribensis]|nr:hypothetical protein BCAR13_410079 [Paraburkholderia caribensis]
MPSRLKALYGLIRVQWRWGTQYDGIYLPEREHLREFRTYMLNAISSRQLLHL